MEETLVTNSFMDVHFPQRIKLIRNLRYVSFFINDIILAGSFIVLFAWVTKIPLLMDFLFQKLTIVPSSSILFIFAGIALFFGARRHISDNDESPTEHYFWWNIWVPVFFSSATAFFGLINVLKLHTIAIFSIFHMPYVAGFCFLLLGLALIPPFTRIKHRFHISQLVIFIVSSLSVFVILENIYQVFSHVPTQHTVILPLSLALTFAFFCFGILLRWSNRGFFGNFTLDSTGSMFAFRIFLINLISAPLIAFVILLVIHGEIYQMLSLLVVFFTFVSSLLLWINVKLLYKYELEHLLMRESLRTHNIDLSAEKEKLQEKMIQVEEEKQQYANKLTIQNAWRDAADTSE